MKKYFLFIITILNINSELFSQPGKLQFSLTGSINTLDTGKMILQAVNNSVYYPFNSVYFETTVRDGKFSFHGPISYPTSYIIGFISNGQWKYLSSNFIVDSGNQIITCIMGNNRMPPEIKNKPMSELLTEFEKAYEPMNQELNDFSVARDSLKNKYANNIPFQIAKLFKERENELNKRADSTLFYYAMKNPSSYVALWELIDNFSSGYKTIYDGIYDQFSDDLKITFTGKALKNQLDSARKTCIGCKFPDIKLANRKSINRRSNILSDSYNYVLVDFWFSHCTPCISQFPKLKDIYSRYKKNGFEIIGISTDSRDQIKNWEKVISTNKLQWSQYLDENGSFAKSISINQFPCNFLLDKEGNIVKRDISPDELDAYLSKITMNK